VKSVKSVIRHPPLRVYAFCHFWGDFAQTGAKKGDGKPLTSLTKTAVSDNVESSPAGDWDICEVGT
jgi:hypothetical protein